MKTKTEQFEVLVPNLDGTAVAERVTVPIQMRWDEELEEWLLTPEAHELVENTKARHMGLLLPAQFKELRERHGCTQKEMGELFQVGEKSWTRWESGRHRPSRSINLLIRALYEGEISINYLLKRAGKPQKEGPELSLKALHSIWISSSWESFSAPSDKDSPEVSHSYEPGNPVVVERKSSSGLDEYLSWFLMRFEQQPRPAEDFWASKIVAPTRRFNRSAPTHTYAQPRLNTPTEA